MKYIKPYNFNENLKTIYDNIISVFKKNDISKSKDKLIDILNNFKNEIVSKSNITKETIAFMYRITSHILVENNENK